MSGMTGDDDEQPANRSAALLLGFGFCDGRIRGTYRVK